MVGNRVIVKKFQPGSEAIILTPGDFILTHRSAFFSKMISFGQKRRYKKADRPFAHWSHAAAIVSENGDLVEALGHGVVKSNISKYRNVEYHVIHHDANMDDRKQMVAFALACVGRPYGFLEIFSLSWTLLSGGSKLTISNEGTLICSALVAEMLCRGDAIFDHPPERCMPADLAYHYGVKDNG